MTDRTGCFSGDDPFEIANRWMAEAAQVELNDPEAAALATVDASGLPNVRMVLLKAICSDGLIFFTNFDSAKAQEINATRKAAIVLHWKSLRRQIRARGSVEQTKDSVSDEYFRTRSVESRLGAWASRQSSVLQSRDMLENRLRQARLTHGEDPSRPPYWGGFRLRPTEIEFWCNGLHRLHDRFLWRRSSFSGGWTIVRLSP